MAGAHPYLGFAACLLYAVVALSCSLAAYSSQRMSNRVFWLSGAVLFVVLASIRVTGFEAFLTESIRDWLSAEGAYRNRRDFQRPMATLAVIALSLALFLFYLKRPRPHSGPRAWPRFWGMIGMVSMCGVVTMRLISFHELDQLLYGPIKANWILDIGSSALVAWAAFRYRNGSGSGARPDRKTL